MIAAIYARVGALVFALALGVPHVAEAECAWVLWGAYEDPRALIAVRQYRPLKALTQGATECEAERGRYKSGQGWVDFVCLPDTMDPRGPKGGGR